MLSRFLASRNDLTRGDDPFFQLQRELSRAVDDVFRGAAGPRPPFGGGFAPSLDVRETEAGLELTSVDVVAEAAWRAVHGERVLTLVGPTARRMAFAARWMPGRLRKMMRRGLGT